MVDKIVIDDHPSGSTVISNVNTNNTRIINCFMDSSAPTSPAAGQQWLDTSGANPLLKQRDVDNATWVLVGTFLDNGDDTYTWQPANTLLLTGGTVTGQIVSSLAIGTSPFEVTSTTKVTNLNGDQVDGCDVSIDGTFAGNSDVLIPSQKAVKTYVGGLIGNVIFVAINSAPTGYLKCNGAAISRTTYAALYSAIGTVFGTGDGSTTFNVPDLRGEFIRGWDDSRGIDSGRSFGSAQTDALKTHVHDMDGVNYAGATGDGTRILHHYNGTSSGLTTLSTGSTETRPRNIALLACIKY